MESSLPVGLAYHVAHIRPFTSETARDGMPSCVRRACECQSSGDAASRNAEAVLGMETEGLREESVFMLQGGGDDATRKKFDKALDLKGHKQSVQAAGLNARGGDEVVDETLRSADRLDDALLLLA